LCPAEREFRLSISALISIGGCQVVQTIRHFATLPAGGGFEVLERAQQSGFSLPVLSPIQVQATHFL
jgi:hypothetical protein